MSPCTSTSLAPNPPRLRKLKSCVKICLPMCALISSTLKQTRRHREWNRTPTDTGQRRVEAPTAAMDAIGVAITATRTTRTTVVRTTITPATTPPIPPLHLRQRPVLLPHLPPITVHNTLSTGQTSPAETHMLLMVGTRTMSPITSTISKLLLSNNSHPHHPHPVIRILLRPLMLQGQRHPRRRQAIRRFHHLLDCEHMAI